MGKTLFETVIAATELPDRPVRDELTDLLSRNGFDAETLTLDQLRDVLADYLQDVFLEAQEKSIALDRRHVV